MALIDRINGQRILPTIATFLLLAGTCASLIFWCSRGINGNAETRFERAPPSVLPPHASVAKSLFGWQNKTFIDGGHFQLRGLLAAKRPEQSAAILQSGDEPVRLFRSGSVIGPDALLVEIHSQYVVILENGTTRRIELPLISGTSQASEEMMKIRLKDVDTPEARNDMPTFGTRESESAKTYPLQTQNPFLGRVRHSAAAG